ncbi:hypothetical protein BC830DRAFT_1078137 [Chytriomyces sp. MP71]|nr:hypothetical protein BC830DRAFT_1078137 [Chytriomyces sp. MP71]
MLPSTLALFCIIYSTRVCAQGAMDVPAVNPFSDSATIYHLGVPNAVQWTNNATQAPQNTIISVMLELGTGSTNQVTTLYQIAQVPFPAATCFDWTPATNLSTSNLYTIIFTGKDAKGGVVSINYCTWFHVADAGSSDSAVTTACPLGSNPNMTATNSVSSISDVVPLLASATVPTLTSSNSIGTSTAAMAATTSKKSGSIPEFGVRGSFHAIAFVALSATLLF